MVYQNPEASGKQQEQQVFYFISVIALNKLSVYLCGYILAIQRAEKRGVILNRNRIHSNFGSRYGDTIRGWNFAISRCEHEISSGSES